MIKKIPFGQDSFRCVLVSDVLTDDDTAVSMIEAAEPSAQVCWVATEWSDDDFGVPTSKKKIQIIVGKKDRETIGLAIDTLQKWYDGSLKLPGLTLPPRPKSVEEGGKKRTIYFGNHGIQISPDSLVWVYADDEVSGPLKCSDLAKKGYEYCQGIQVQPTEGGDWVDALEYAGIKDRVLPPKPKAPAKPSDPAKPEAPAKPAPPPKGKGKKGETELVDVTEQVQAKLLS